MRTLVLVFVAAPLAFSSGALADVPSPDTTGEPSPNQSFPVGFRDYMTIGDLDRTTYDPQVQGGPSNIVWVNPCVGDCQFTLVADNQDDAQNDETSIRDQFNPLPLGTTVTISEFKFSQDTYNAAVECLREVYRPYDIEIVTEEPAPGVIHHEAVLAGTATELGIQENTNQGQILGIAPSICRMRDNVASFSFANAHPDNPTQLCWTLSHEIGHAFGLEHEFACEDPMTYLTECGFRKFFRNQELPCGAFEKTTTCFCGGAQTQNTHEWLLGIFGPGEGARAPSLSLLTPMPDAVVDDGYPILVDASDVRGIDRVEFYINDRLVSTLEEPNASTGTGFVYITPGDQSDGVQNIEVRAYNDLEVMTSASVTAVKGIVCQSNDDCGIDEECDGGACTVLPPSVENGDECATDDQCFSGQCTNSSEGARCTTSCVPGIEGACESGFTCLASSGASGVCWPDSDSGGCAVASDSPASEGTATGAWLMALGLLAIPRRRRRR